MHQPLDGLMKSGLNSDLDSDRILLPHNLTNELRREKWSGCMILVLRDAQVKRGQGFQLENRTNAEELA